MRKVFLIAAYSVFIYMVARAVTMSNMTIDLEPTADLYKTVSHVDLSNFKDLQLVYDDAENDIAYYMYTGTRRPVKVGDVVTIAGGDKFKITAIDCLSFTMQPVGAMSVTYGYSGMGVKNVDGVQIGCISAIDDDNNIYCIWT